MNYKRLLFMWLLIVMFSGGAWAQTYTDNIVRNFKLSAKSSVEVYNKYGKVHVRTWDKDSVRFEVSLRIQTTNADKLKKLKNQINFDFTSTNFYIVAKTEFVKSGGVFSDLVETVVPSNEVSINYIVYIPKTTTLKIENKFGDVYIDDYNGNIILNLSNGNLKANGFYGNTSIALSTGHAVINSIERGSFNVSYSELEIKDAGRVEIDSRHSEVIIAKADVAKLVSKSDKYKVGEVKTISGQGNFTKLTIERLLSEINFSNKYYGIVIESISTRFNFININSEFTDLDLIFDKGVSYNLDITHHEDVHITYPANLAKLETKQISPEERMMLTYGPVGADATPSSAKVKIMAAKKCYINILHR